MLSNLSMDQDGTKNILLVVVVALVLYLLVTYIRDHKHNQYQLNEEPVNDLVNQSNNQPNNNQPNNNQVLNDGFDDYEGFGNHDDDEQRFGLTESFEDKETANNSNAPEASMGVGRNDPHGLVDSNEQNIVDNLPNECYPKDVLSSQDLLPNDANSKFAQVNPSGPGSLNDKNFLTAGYHVGINTVGQSLRNANRQLRSDPPNPQVKVSPWMQTTIEPDLNRQPLEIGGN